MTGQQPYLRIAQTLLDRRTIMPANLTPQYMSAEQRFKQASTHEEKIACLEEMLLVVDLGDPAVLDAAELIADVLQEWKILPTARALTPTEEEALAVGVVARRALLLGNKCDVPASKDNWDIVQELYTSRWPTLAV